MECPKLKEDQNQSFHQDCHIRHQTPTKRYLLLEDSSNIKMTFSTSLSFQTYDNL